MSDEKSPLNIGDIFGTLTVMGPSRKDSKSRRYYPVKCTCGKIFESRKDTITSLRVNSCGCLTNEYKARVTHGMSGTHEYHVWENMIQRCYNTKSSGYDCYGGVGIEVNSDWKNSFQNFFADMGMAPIEHSLDRIDPRGNYCKENCRWTTASNQSYNTKRREDNTSGKTGVSWVKAYEKWYAYIRKDGILYNLGYFDSFTSAVDARVTAEMFYYGFNVE